MLRRPLTINERYRLQFGTERRSDEFSGLENPSKWLFDLLTGGTTTSGATVNDTTAMSMAAVYACNRVLCDSIASLPVGLYKHRPGGGVDPADNRPENELVSNSPSPRYTSFSFRSTLQLHLGLRGNAYARILRDGRGGARELRILNPHNVVPFYFEGNLFYRLYPETSDEKPEVLTPMEILHIAGMSKDGVNGISPIQALRETIGLALTNRSNAAKTLGRGRVDGILKHPNELTLSQANNVRETFVKTIQKGEFPLLQHGLEYQSISLSPQDAEFISTHKLTVRDIAGAYRVPLHMIGDLERATFSNIEHQSLEFVKFSLMPWIKAWEMELNRKVLPVALQSTHFFRFNVEGLLRGDIRARMEAYTKAIQWGILNRDEVRELENRNPIPDDLGQVFLTPLNMTALTEETVNGDPNMDQEQKTNASDESQQGSR